MNTEFNLRDYARPETAGHAVTGRIAQRCENSFQLKTPLAIIGGRGADF